MINNHTRDGISVAAIFAAGWFLFLLIANVAGVDINLTQVDSALVWVCYFTFVSVIASIFLMRPKWMIRGLHVWLLGGVTCVGGIGAVELYMSGADIVPDLIVSAGFAIVGFLFARVFNDKISRQIQL